MTAVFRKVLDVCIKELLSKGSGTKVRQVDSIMPEDEEKIWTRGIFGLDSSQELKYTDIQSKGICRTPNLDNCLFHFEPSSCLSSKK